jgi:hypothetical protein
MDLSAIKGRLDAGGYATYEALLGVRRPWVWEPGRPRTSGVSLGRSLAHRGPARRRWC